MSKTKFDGFKNHLTVRQGLSEADPSPAPPVPEETLYEEEFEEYEQEENIRENIEESEIQQPAQIQEEIQPEAELVDINYANVKELLEIKGITYPIARNIVKFRNSHGSFQNWDSLNKVPGINKKILENMKKNGVLLQD